MWAAFAPLHAFWINFPVKECNEKLCAKSRFQAQKYQYLFGLSLNCVPQIIYLKSHEDTKPTDLNEMQALQHNIARLITYLIKEYSLKSYYNSQAEQETNA